MTEAVAHGAVIADVPEATREPESRGRAGSVAGLTDEVSPRVLDKWALVIGIKAYRDPDIEPISYADSDARAVYESLLDPAVGRFKVGHVRRLINEEATTVNLRKAIGWLSERAHRDDLVVIFVSSHGSPSDLDTAGVNYIVTYDTELDSADRSALYATAFPMAELEDVINRRLQAQRVVILMDTCYSAGVFKDVQVASLSGAKALRSKGVSLSPRTVQSLTQGVGRVLITSSRSDERSWESDRLGHGYFTYYLLEALRERDGMATVEEIYNRLRDTLPVRVQADTGQSQNPVIGKRVRGPEIVIGVPTD